MTMTPVLHLMAAVVTAVTPLLTVRLSVSVLRWMARPTNWATEARCVYPATTPVNPTALCAATDSASATSGCVTRTQTVVTDSMKMRICVVSS